MNAADKEAQAELAQQATWIFNAASAHLFRLNLKANRECKLQADL